MDKKAAPIWILLAAYVLYSCQSQVKEREAEGETEGEGG